MMAATPETLKARECQLLQTVFSAELTEGVRPGGRTVVSYRPRGAPRALAGFMPTLAASLDVPKPKAERLAAKSAAQPDVAWQATCAWPVAPGPVTYAFSRPVFSDDGRLAAFEWDGGFGDINQEGKLCLASLKDTKWTLRCVEYWVR